MYVSTSYLWSIRVQTMESCCRFVFYNNTDSFWRPCLGKSLPQEREKQIASSSLFVKTTFAICWFCTAHLSPRITKYQPWKRAPTATLLKWSWSKRKVKRFIGQSFLVCLWKYLICFQNFIVSISFHWIVNFSLLLRYSQLMHSNVHCRHCSPPHV